MRISDDIMAKLELGSRNLKDFVSLCWSSVEGNRLFIPGWHIDAICDHLEAVELSEIKQLMILMPPRHMKSLTVSVFFPGFVWLHNSDVQFLFSSYSMTLSERDSVSCRTVMTSQNYLLLKEWCKQNWVLKGDQNTKRRFENSSGGYRIATSVDGALTGDGGDILIVDDPHNIMEAESEAVRKNSLKWWDESMSTRLNNPKTGRRVVICQRSHENDLVGHILEKEKGNWTILCLPARYEKENRSFSSSPSIQFKDPRTREGEPLWKDMYGEKELLELEKKMGPYASAAQLQQRPVPREGGMFKIDCFQIVSDFDTSQIARVVRYWDKAGTAGGGAYSVGTKMAKLKNGRAIVLDVVRGQWSPEIRERRIRQCCEMDGRNCYCYIEQEPGSSGKETVKDSITKLAGFKVYADRVSGSKEVRAEPYACQVNVGNVQLLFGTWNQDFLDEHGLFPNSKYKDQVDASAGAFSKLFSTKKCGAWPGLEQLDSVTRTFLRVA